MGLVNDKLRDLKFIHQQELQKERQIANVLVTNHQKQIETLKERQQMMQPNNTNNNNNYQLVQMQQEMDQLKKLYQQSLYKLQIKNNFSCRFFISFYFCYVFLLYAMFCSCFFFFCLRQILYYILSANFCLIT